MLISSMAARFHEANQQNTIECNILISFIILQVTVINLKKLLTCIDANLRYNSNGPNNIPMFHNVMTVHRLQNVPIFQLPIERLVSTPHPILHCLMLGLI